MTGRQRQALVFCDEVYREWVGTAPGVELTDTRCGANSSQTEIAAELAVFFEVRGKYGLALARYGWVSPVFFSRFVLVDSPSMTPSFTEALGEFDGVPLTVVRLTRSSGTTGRSIDAMRGQIDFEFNPLKETRADFCARLDLHFSVLQKSQEWKSAGAVTQLIYAVATACMLPALATLFGNLLFEGLKPYDGMWPRIVYSGLSICALLIICGWLFVLPDKIARKPIRCMTSKVT
ncbi:MAG: hypothetical protein SFV23_12005 [Planctomycetaceae bacterium]|nr:hypothetical protein [Planctomycetaceae bacterium]